MSPGRLASPGRRSPAPSTTATKSASETRTADSGHRRTDGLPTQQHRPWTGDAAHPHTRSGDTRCRQPILLRSRARRRTSRLRRRLHRLPLQHRRKPRARTGHPATCLKSSASMASSCAARGWMKTRCAAHWRTTPPSCSSTAPCGERGRHDPAERQKGRPGAHRAPARLRASRYRLPLRAGSLPQAGANAPKATQPH